MYDEFLSESLTDEQAQDRLSQIGLNELPQSKKEYFWTKFAKLFREPMLLILVSTAIIYLFMGDLGEGIMLVGSAFVVVAISMYQERKSERALASLRELSSPRALVIRNGIERRVSATQLVPEDLIVLHEGDRVPADGHVLQVTNLSIDESLLTGESFPVKKLKSDLVYSSTLVVSGSALVRISKTGILTEVGKIGKSLQEIEPDELNLTKEIRQIVKLFAWSGALICIAIILIYGVTRGDWLQAFLVGLSTEMALLPEEFPVVLTIFLALGAWRLSKLQVLIRKPGSIERLGAVTILCVDKTGTLTQNQMSVAQINNSKSSIVIDLKSADSLSEEFHEVSEFGVLASHKDPFDPMEKAIRRMVVEGKWGQDHIHQDWDLIRDYPLSDKLLAMSCVWKDPNSDAYVIAAKGAPEAVLDLCHLDKSRSEEILIATKEMAKHGLRILGVAKASFLKTELPKDQHDFDFKWLGLIGLEDPLRPEVPEAVQMCRDAGIRVIMMTGDYPETALKIAGKAGIDTTNSLITGTEINLLTDQQLSEKLKTAHIFARMIPDQKLRIVKLLKNLGHVVGMTGDGVNDAPSLKWADIGISMGARGTDVAREASDIVLLDDNFASIVSGIRRGRLIFNNIRKAMAYIVSIHIPIAGLSIIPVILKWPIILLPIHIVFLELIIDPACSLMFESQPPEEHIMKSPPRALKSKLFSGSDLLKSFLQGIFVLVVIYAVLTFDAHIVDAPDRERTLGFLILTMSNIGLIFADMCDGSWRQLIAIFKEKSNWLIVLLVITCLLITIVVPQIRNLFHFESIQPHEFIASIGIAVLVFIIISMWNRMTQHH